jgi:hypothetical protein
MSAAASAKFGILLESLAAISHERSFTTIPLSKYQQSPNELDAALRRASGLIPFLLWIGSGDHGKEANYVGTPQGQSGAELLVEAIDFGNCFEFHENGLDGVAIWNRLKDNADKDRVEGILSKIEKLSDESIQAVCKESRIANPEALAMPLISRKGKLRCWLEHGRVI